VRQLSYRVPSTKRKGDLTIFNVDYPNNIARGGKLSFVLPDAAIKDFKAGEVVYIKFQTHLAVGPFLGSSTKNLLLIATHDWTATDRVTTEINKTMAHEVGHALGMVAGGISIPGIADPAAEHTRAYTG